MSFWTGVSDAIRSYYCVATSLVANSYDMFRPVLFRGLNLPTGLVDPVIDWLTIPRRSICNDTPDYRSQASPGFERAQCPVVYKIYHWLDQFDGSGNVTRSDYYNGFDLIWGEIREKPYARFAAGVGSQILISYYGYGSGYYPRQSGYGESFVNVANYNANTRSFAIRDLMFVRADGLPDDCGDPPPVIPPPVNNYNQYDVDVTYNDNDGNDITVPVTLIYGQAFIDADFNVQIPVKVNLTPQVSFNATLNVQTGDIKFNLAPTIDLSGGTYNIGFGGDNRSTTNTTNYYVGGDPPPPPDGSESDDTPPPTAPQSEQLIRGVIVTVTAHSGVMEGVFFQDGGNPDIYIPNLGYVQFAIRVGSSVSWTADKPVKSLRSFIPCDWEGGAVDVQGTPRPGVEWTLTPVYGSNM